MSDALTAPFGPLRPTRWSRVEIDEPLARSLRRSALKDCPQCQGRGYRGRRPNATPCTCVIMLTHRKPADGP
jgi:uncharacterized protein (DUF983 family)